MWTYEELKTKSGSASRGENGKRSLGDQYNSPPAHNAFGKEPIQKNPFSYAQNGQD